MAVKPGYKQTEVGVIPEDWGAPKLLLVLEKIQLGGNYPNSPIETSWPLIKMGNLNRGLINLDKLEFIPSKPPSDNDRLQIDDVLLNTRNTMELVGKVAIWRGELFEAYFNSNIARLKFDTRHVSSNRFMNYIMNTPLFLENLRGIAIGTTSVAAIYARDLKRLSVPLPRHSEQEAIAEALSDADALIESLEQLLAKKRHLKQGAMQQLLRPKKGWVTCKLRSLGSFLKGGGVRKDEALSGDLACIRYGEIYTRHNDVIRDFQSWISPQIAAGATRLKSGDILFAGSGETKEAIGKCVAFVDDTEAYAGGDIVILRPENSDSTFLGYYLNTATITAQKASRGQGDAVVHIGSTALGDIDLKLPATKPEQTAIATTLSDLDAEITALEVRLTKARQLKQGMMQELLTGRIRLAPATTNVVPFPAPQKPAADIIAAPKHNRQIEEAAVFGVLAKTFGTEAWPLPRKRRIKLIYLLDRYTHRSTAGYLKKAAGPYNPAIKYKGGETIAQKNHYVRLHNNGKYVGFVVGDKVAQAEKYFNDWYGANALSWIEQFRFHKTDELELLATVDKAMDELRTAGKPVTVASVKQLIHDAPEWTPKLLREIFSDANLARAITTCENLFA